MNKQKYSKFLAGIIANLILFALIISPAFAAMPNNKVSDVKKTHSLSNAIFSKDNSSPLNQKLFDQSSTIKENIINSNYLSQFDNSLLGILNSNISHNCAVKRDETLVCWGRNDYYQSTPPNGLFTKVDVGAYFSCAIKKD